MKKIDKIFPSPYGKGLTFITTRTLRRWFTKAERALNSPPQNINSCNRCLERLLTKDIFKTLKEQI